MVSGTKWDQGGGMRPLVCGGWDGCCEAALGLRLRGPEECVAWEGLAASGLVLRSGRPGTGPSLPGTDGVDSGLWSGWYCSRLSVTPLEVKVKKKIINMNSKKILLFKTPFTLF